MNRLREQQHYFIAALILAAVSAVFWLSVSPQHEFPLNDDWAYYQMLQHLLKTGEFRMSQWAATTLVFQTYAAAGLAYLLGGFSFTSARVLTLLFGYIGCLALYDLLLQLSISRRGALLGALALVVNPLYVYLSYTFMSDVYFVSLLTLSLTLYVRGVQRGSVGLLLIGSLFATATFLTRQIGIAIPAGILITLWLKERKFHWKWLIAAGLIPFLIMAVYAYWLRFVHGLTWTLEMNIVYGTTSFLRQPIAIPTIALRVLMLAIYLGMFSLPIIVAQLFSLSLNREHWTRLARLYGIWLTLLGTLATILLVTRGQMMPYLSNGINRAGLGPLTLAGQKTPVTPDWVFWLVTLIAPFVGAAEGAWLTDMLLHPRRESNLPSAPLLFASLIMLLLTLTTYWFWDEYLMVFIPLGIYLALRAGNIASHGFLAGVIVSAALLLYGVIEVGDNLAWNTARWQAGQMLVAQGVSPDTIDGGFEWIGWYEFETALPKAIAQGKWADQFAWASLTPDRFVLAFQALPGYHVIDRVSYQAPLIGPAGNIYVLEK